MAFWDSWSNNQKLAALGGLGVVGLLLFRGGGGGGEGELAIVDVRRPTDDINLPGGPAAPIGRLDITNYFGTPTTPGTTPPPVVPPLVEQPPGAPDPTAARLARLRGGLEFGAERFAHLRLEGITPHEGERMEYIRDIQKRRRALISRLTGQPRETRPG